ncbi:MAG: DUF1080 domain-containing protein [Prevotellaceae bacterium]|jgi:hypothetical protein|nr:DUF1080 domain-containing protein [Prevotellaceae bacterium]
MKKIIFTALLGVTTVTGQLFAQKTPTPQILKSHKDISLFTKLKGETVTPISLFNGKNFNGWYTYTDKYGKNNDVEKAFRIEDGVMRFDGESMGYLCTKQTFKNYYLRVVFRWGEKKYPPRKDSKRDSGVLYHFSTSAADKVWPTSIECQIQEDDCGDYWCIGTTADSPNQIENNGLKRIIRTENFETSDWNTIEIICIDDKSEHYVNGHLVNNAYNLSQTKGKILLQLECAEVFYKTVEMLPLK